MFLKIDLFGPTQRKKTKKKKQQQQFPLDRVDDIVNSLAKETENLTSMCASKTNANHYICYICSAWFLHVSYKELACCLQCRMSICSSTREDNDTCKFMVLRLSAKPAMCSFALTGWSRVCRWK